MIIKNLSVFTFLLAASATVALPAQGRGRRRAPPPPPAGTRTRFVWRGFRRLFERPSHHRWRGGCRVSRTPGSKRRPWRSTEDGLRSFWKATRTDTLVHSAPQTPRMHAPGALGASASPTRDQTLCFGDAAQNLPNTHTHIHTFTHPPSLSCSLSCTLTHICARTCKGTHSDTHS